MVIDQRIWAHSDRMNDQDPPSIEHLLSDEIGNILIGSMFSIFRTCIKEFQAESDSTVYPGAVIRYYTRRRWNLLLSTSETKKEIR